MNLDTKGREFITAGDGLRLFTGKMQPNIRGTEMPEPFSQPGKQVCPGNPLVLFGEDKDECSRPQAYLVLFIKKTHNLLVQGIGLLF